MHIITSQAKEKGKWRNKRRRNSVAKRRQRRVTIWIREGEIKGENGEEYKKEIEEEEAKEKEKHDENYDAITRRQNAKEGGRGYDDRA